MYNRLLPLLVSLVALGGLEALLINHRLLYGAVIAVNAVMVWAVWRMAKDSSVSKEWWHFSIMPVVYFSSVVMYTTLLRLEDKFFIQFLYLFSTAVLYLFFRFSYFFLLRPMSYKVSSIENLSSYANFLSFYFIAASLYGFQAFLKMSAWPLLLGLAAACILMIYQLFWASKISFKSSATYLFVIASCLLEAAWALSFWPLNFHVVGLSLAIGYYVLANLARFTLLGQIDGRRIKYNLWFAGVSLGLLWLTARWL
ncbi:hypothetical protein HGA34_03920 [Candidatus Falkowbacteria bacterium]|nr:hypothetical protein [Candidatus Falkowbacteria bacterium]